MARSNKPVIWLPFAAGGTVAAFCLPAVAVTMLLATSGAIDGGDVLTWERAIAVFSTLLGKLALAVIVLLPLWHAAHRLRMTIQDLGLRDKRARKVLARTCYSVAALVTGCFLFFLGGLPWT